MRRHAVRTLSAVAAVTLAAGIAAPPAQATAVTTGATAYSAGASTGSAGLTTTLTLTGTVGGLLNGLISPIVSSAIDPLVSALQSTVNTSASAALGSGSSDNAGAPSQQTGPKPGTFPNDAFPSSCSATSTTQPCYSAASSSVNAALASLTTGVIRGYTQQTQPSDDATNPIFGRAEVAGVAVSALSGISSLTSPLVSAGVVDAQASCPNDGSTAPSASVSATNVSVLGGLVTLGVANGAITNLKVNGTTLGSLGSLSPTTVGGVSVQPYGTALKVSVSLTLANLLSALNLSGSAVSELLGDVTTSSLTLSVIVGPNTSITSTGANAWGLGVGVDLSGSLTFNLLDLVGARVLLPSGVNSGNYGNLVDLRLAYASCTVGSGGGGSSGTTPAVPPANV